MPIFPFLHASGTGAAPPVVNQKPTLSAFDLPVDNTAEDTEVEITFAELLSRSDASDVDGSVVAFVVKSISAGTLRIGANSGAATPWAAGTNDIVQDTSKKIYWTPPNSVTGSLAAFTAVAKDDDDAESTPPRQALVNVSSGGVSLHDDFNVIELTMSAATPYDLDTRIFGGAGNSYEISPDSNHNASVCTINSLTSAGVLTLTPTATTPGQTFAQCGETIIRVRVNGTEDYDILVLALLPQFRWPTSIAFDKDGWLNLQPHASAQFVCVHPRLGNDSNPAQTTLAAAKAAPVATIANGRTKLRAGQADQLLLAQGEDHVGNLTTWALSGLSPTFPMVIGDYKHEWLPNTTYSLNHERAANGNVYICTTAGTSAASGTGPSGTGTGISDGTCVWNFLKPLNRPRVLHGTTSGFSTAGSDRRNILLRGLWFYTHRNPDDIANYAGSAGAGSINITASGLVQHWQDIYIEDCRCSWGAGGITMQHQVGSGDFGTSTNALINRCAVNNNWKAGGGHDQGIFSHFVGMMHIIDTCTDRGGWLFDRLNGDWPLWTGSTVYTAGQKRNNGANIYICVTGGTSAASGGPTGTGAGISDGTVVWNFLRVAETNNTNANTFNHNLYMDNGNRTAGPDRRVYIGGIARESSSHGIQLRAGGVLHQCVHFRCPLPFLVGGGDNYWFPENSPDGVVGDQRFCVALYTNDINSANVRGIVNACNNVINGLLTRDNLFFYDISSPTANSWGYQVISHAPPRLGTHGLRGSNNVFYNFHQRGGFALSGSNFSNLVASNNYYDITASQPVPLTHTGAMTGTNFNVDLQSPLPTRDIASYSASIGGAGTEEDFMQKRLAMRRDTWDVRYEARFVYKHLADEINAWYTPTAFPVAS